MASKHKTIRTVLLLISFNGHVGQAQPAIEWQKCLGGTSKDEGFSIVSTDDGGYAIAGYSSSTNGDVVANDGGADMWLVKLDITGDLVWEKTFGGPAGEWARSIRQTSDGGFVLAGFCDLNGGDVLGNHGGQDAWVVKVNASGSFQWQRSLGGMSGEQAYSVVETSDGGYAVAGYCESTNSIGSDVTGNHGGRDFWVVKLDGSGVLLWQKSLGGSVLEEARSMRQTADGGFIVAGFSKSNDGDVTGHHGPSGNGLGVYEDCWVVKLNGGGDIEWQNSYGGTDSDYAHDIIQTSDGGYAVSGYTRSDDGDVTDNLGGADFWLLRLNPSGGILWQKNFGGSSSEEAFAIRQLNDDGFVLAGKTNSNNFDVTGQHGQNDFWVIRTTSNGDLLWEDCLGGSYLDDAYAIDVAVDGGYIITGRTWSEDFDVTGHHGPYAIEDVWVVKLEPDNVGISVKDRIPFSVAPNPSSGVATIVFEANTQPIYIALVDASGRTVSTQFVATHSGFVTIDLSDHERGLYLVRCEFADGRTSSLRLAKN